MNNEEKLYNIHKYLKDNEGLIQPLDIKTMPSMLLVSTLQPTWLHSTLCAIANKVVELGLRWEISNQTKNLVIYSY